MPQFDMIILSPEQVAGADVIEHVKGKPAIEGGGEGLQRALDVSRPVHPYTIGANGLGHLGHVYVAKLPQVG